MNTNSKTKKIKRFFSLRTTNYRLRTAFPLRTTNYVLRTSSGFVFLITVLVIGAIAAASAVSVLLLSLGSSRSSFTRELSLRARAMADACTEEALEVIRDDNKFSGSGSLSIDGNTCSYTVTNTGGQTREVRSTGDAQSARRKVKALVSKIKPTIILSSWQEVADF